MDGEFNDNVSNNFELAASSMSQSWQMAQETSSADLQPQIASWPYVVHPDYDPSSMLDGELSILPSTPQDFGLMMDGRPLHHPERSACIMAAASSTPPSCQILYGGVPQDQVTIPNFHMSTPPNHAPLDIPFQSSSQTSGLVVSAPYPPSTISVDTTSDERYTCPICFDKKGAARDLRRHLWARHPDYATRYQVRSEKVSCPYPGCSHTGRKDNVNRHVRTKHGGSIA